MFYEVDYKVFFGVQYYCYCGIDYWLWQDFRIRWGHFSYIILFPDKLCKGFAQVNIILFPAYNV